MVSTTVPRVVITEIALTNQKLPKFFTMLGWQKLLKNSLPHHRLSQRPTPYYEFKVSCLKPLTTDREIYVFLLIWVMTVSVKHNLVFSIIWKHIGVCIQVANEISHAS